MGSFVIGFVATHTVRKAGSMPRPTHGKFIMVGFCGGYTTFSSFSLQTLTPMNDGEWLHAGTNVVLSVACCMIAVSAGHLLASSLNAVKWA